MGKTFIFDAAKCNGCRNCQLACKDEHVDNEWLPYSKPQPDTGQFWTRIEERIRGQVPKVKIAYIMHMCQHCDGAPCMSAAPEAVYKRDDGLVIIDPSKAKGHKELVEACPYGAIFWNEELEIPQKCTAAPISSTLAKSPIALTYVRTEPFALATRRSSLRSSSRPRRSCPSAPIATGHACIT